MQSKRVWLLLDSRDIGGIETHVALLATELRKRGCSVVVTFMAKYGEHPLLDRLRAANVEFQFIDGTLPSLYRAIRQQRPAVIHTHGYKAGIAGKLFGKWLGVPALSTYHSGEPGVGRVRWYLAIDRALSHFASNIAVSDEIARRLPAPSRVIPNFVPTAHTNLSNSPLTVAFVGRLSAEKGPDTFCELATRVDGVKFVVYGDGPMRSELEQQYGHAVDFRGRVNSMESYWGEIGLLCLSSRNEGLPLAGLEAMAHRVPLAAFAVGDVAKLIPSGTEGYLVEPGDVRGMAQALRAWADSSDETRRAMGSMAQRHITQNFSESAVMPEILKAYSAVLKV